MRHYRGDVVEPTELEPPTCELCGSDHLKIEVYRPPRKARIDVPIGRGRTMPKTSREPGFVFFRCHRCGREGGCSVPDSYRPPR